MPYEPKRTIIQMAPRNMLPGIRLHQAKIARGMGQANCPSLEQLFGISDPNDPCQAGAALSTTEQIQALPVAAPGGLTTAPIVVPAATTSLSTWASQNSSTILVVGGVLFALAIFGAMGKR
jgi:hypothetical protein